MANKQLTASVRLNTTQAERSVDRLIKKINRINSAVDKTNGAKVEQQLNKSNNRLAEIKNKVGKWAINQRDVLSKTRSTNSVLKSVFGRLRSILGMYVAIRGVSLGITSSDSIVSAENKLNYVSAQQYGSSGYNSDGSYSVKTLDTTQESMDKMYASSQKVRMSYSDMMSNVSKSMALAGDSFQNSIDNATRFQEIMAEAYTLGGASAQEMSTSMYQMIQALGAGILAGDELRSVREGAPLAYKAIEKFAQSIYNTDESLKDLASQGKITSDIVVSAIMQEGDAMDNAFKQTQRTFAQTWNQIKNAALYAFRPVSKLLSEMLNKAVDSGLVEKLSGMFVSLAKGIMIVIQAIYNAIVWIADNWNWLKNVIVAGLIVLVAYLIYSAVMTVYTTIIKIAAWLAELATWQLLTITIIAGVLALLYVYYLWKNGTINTVDAICIALMVLAAVFVVIAAICTAGIYLIIAAIILLVVAAIYYFEYVAGAVMWLCATILNIIIGLINAILQNVWRMVEPIIGVVEWILNACMGGFDSFGGAVANLIGQVISWFLSLGKVVTKIIDAIFGTNWTSGLTSLQDKVLAWGKKEDSSITISREAPQLKRIDATDAFNTGLSWGNNLKTSLNDWVNDWGSQYQGDDSGSLLDKIGNGLGLDFGNMTNAFPNPADPNYDVSDVWNQPTPDELLNGINGINDNTEMSAEDLSYLRTIAEKEWKKEFTTANITVDMSNYNTINGEQDLDGIVTKLSEKLYEEMNAVADGVYV